MHYTCTHVFKCGKVTSEKQWFERREDENIELSARDCDVVDLMLKLKELLPCGCSCPAAGASFSHTRTPTGTQHCQLQRLDLW